MCVSTQVPRSKAYYNFPFIRERADTVNRLLAEWAAAAEPPVPFVDMNAIIPCREDDSTEDLWSLDGLHFSKAGSGAVGVGLAPLLTAFLSTLK